VGDIDTQPLNNYEYDDSGNLISDIAENIEKMEWNVHGKIKLITRPSGADLSVQPNTSFRYGPMGNRTIKVIQTGPNASDLTYTYYVRDASGNVMGIYEGKNSGSSMSELYLKEQHLYGNSRLGIKQSDIPAEDLANYTAPLGITNRTAGQRFYELSNHLGNVLSTVSDNKLLAYQGTALPKYKAEIISYSDYYPFGWEMPGRGGSSEAYRYGFNGKEKDDEGEVGSLTTYDYGFRIYNPAIAKFLSVDPLTKSYPELTPYQFASNSPIENIDIDGLEKFSVHVRSFAPFDVFALFWKGDGVNRKYSVEPNAVYRTGAQMNYDADLRSVSAESYDPVWSRTKASWTKIGAYSGSEVVANNTSDGFNFHSYGDNDAIIPFMDGVGFGYSPTWDIDMKGDLNISKSAGKDGNTLITISGTVTGDAFPSSELYISQEDGTNGVFLGVSPAQFNEHAGPYFALAGNNSRPMMSINPTTIVFDANNNIKGVLQNGSLIGISEWNQQFSNKPVADKGEKSTDQSIKP